MMVKERRRYEKKNRRIRRIKNFFTFLLGLLIGGGGLFASYYFYYEPILASQLETKINKKDQEINKLTGQVDLFKKDLADNKGDKFAFVPRNLKNNGNFQKLSGELDKKIKQSGYIGSVLVIKDNQLVLDQGYGYGDKGTGLLNNSDTKFMLASMQKAFTATLIMRLVEGELLSLDTKLAEYYPDIPNSQNITISQLVTMTSGLSLKGSDKQARKEQDAIDYAVANTTYEKPTRWRYAAINYTLLTGIIREITGRSYQEYLTSEIIEPLNLTDTEFSTTFYQEPNHAISYDVKNPAYEQPLEISDNQFINDTGTGNMYLSTRDLLTFYQALIDGKLISAESLTSLWTLPSESYVISYAGGVYHKDGTLYGHGHFRGYEPTMQLSRDGNTGVITLSNYAAKDNINTGLTKEIYQMLIS